MKKTINIFSVARARYAGFTLVEIMIAMALFVLLMSGILSVYLLCRKSWYSTSLHMEVSRAASMAISKMVYGAGTNSGLRECSGAVCDTNMQGVLLSGGGYPPPAASARHYLAPAGAGAPDGSWRLTITNYAGRVAWLDYNKTASNIVLWAETNDITSRLSIGNHISHAAAVPTAEGVMLTVAACQSDGGFTFTVTNQTFIKLRN